MSVQKSITIQMLLLFILFNLNGILTIKRDHKQVVNLTEQAFDKERDPRQYVSGYGSGAGFGDYGLSSFGSGPIEAIIIGLLVVAAFGVIGIPFFLLFLGLFNGGGIGGLGGLGSGIGGLNLVPTTTTAVTGRKKREVNSLLPEVNPLVEPKLLNAFENFMRSPDKIKLIEKLLDSMVGRN